VSEYSGAPARRGRSSRACGAGAPLRERTVGHGSLTVPTSASEEAA
jgi:hypothetical protein